MNHNFTEQIKQWLDTPAAERDYTVGALYLLKLSGNQIMYRNIISQIDRRSTSKYPIWRSFLTFRLMCCAPTSPTAIENAHRNLLDMEDDE